MKYQLLIVLVFISAYSYSQTSKPITFIEVPNTTKITKQRLLQANKIQITSDSLSVKSFVIYLGNCGGTNQSIENPIWTFIRTDNYIQDTSFIRILNEDYHLPTCITFDNIKVKNKNGSDSAILPSFQLVIDK
jgi:hypothetical protein